MRRQPLGKRPGIQIGFLIQPGRANGKTATTHPMKNQDNAENNGTGSGSNSFGADTILVADIGGTNARLASVQTATSGGAPKITGFTAFPCADYNELDAVLEAYKSSQGGELPERACLAVAGPIIGRTAHITNLGWDMDADQLENAFGFDRLHIVNDFAALARSTPTLGNDDLITLREGTLAGDGPVSVMGPGTGFGLALLVQHSGGCTVVSGEGGHVSFVPHGAQETRVWSALQKSIGRVTVETLLSGVGLMRIYRELCHMHDTSPLNYDPRTISYQALEHGDKICLETLNIFCSMLGSVAGDMVLSHGATGGVFLGGGILPKIANFFLQSNFTERFLDKPPMQKFVEKVPVHLIVAPDAALRGAALLYQEHESKA